jgi:hypothetical protein
MGWNGMREASLVRRPNPSKSAQRIRLDCESEANHNLNRLLDEPGGNWKADFIIRKQLLGFAGCGEGSKAALCKDKPKASCWQRLELEIEDLR